MSDRIKWIEYKNKELLYANYAGLYGDEYKEEFKKLREFIVNSGKDHIKGLLNTSNTYVNKDVFNEVENTAKAVDHHVSKVAIIGSTKIQEIFIKIVRNLTHIQLNTFDTEVEGKEWLVKDNK